VRRIAVVIACALALPVSVAQAWTWPVDGPVLRPFSFDRAHPYAAGQHRGVDIGAPSGSVVVAPAEGVVSFAGTVPGGGKTVSIQTPFGYTGTLVHLGSIGVSRGALVGEGSVVGTVGPSGDVESADPFVYFGVRTTSDAQGYVDPLTLLPPRAALVAAAPDAPASAQTPAAEPAAVPPVKVAQPEAAPVASDGPAAEPALRAAASSQPPQETPLAAPQRDATAAPAAAESAPQEAVSATQQSAPMIGAGQVAPAAVAPALAPELVSLVVPSLGPAVHMTPEARAEGDSLPATPIESAVYSRTTARTTSHRLALDAGVRTGARPDSHARLSGRAARLSDAGAGHPLAWALLLGVAAAAVALGLGLYLRTRPKRLDTLPIMASGEQLLHHNSDLLRQLDAPHRPRVHDDRGRHPRAPSQAAGGPDVLPHRDGRARLEGLPGGRGAGPGPESVCRPDRRVLERAA
jgi:hypothetical protein